MDWDYLLHIRSQRKLTGWLGRNEIQSHHYFDSFWQRPTYQRTCNRRLHKKTTELLGVAAKLITEPTSKEMSHWSGISSESTLYIYDWLKSRWIIELYVVTFVHCKERVRLTRGEIWLHSTAEFIDSIVIVKFYTYCISTVPCCRMICDEVALRYWWTATMIIRCRGRRYPYKLGVYTKFKISDQLT